jgi:hypothetical protein
VWGTERQTNTSKGRSSDQLQYGRETFVVCSEFLRRVRFAPSVASRLGCLADGKGLAASVRLFVYLPRLTVSLSSSTSGREIGAHLRHTRWGVPHTRLAQGVLVVPPTQEEYLRGRARQAVRTNVRRAKALGLVCRRVRSRAEQRQVAEYMVAHRPQSEEMAGKYRRHLNHRDTQCWMVEAPDRTPAGLAVLNVDTEVAVLWSLVSLEHSAKWLLHTHVVGELAAAGVRYLLTSSRMAPLMSARDQYLQQLLGYRVAHLSLGPPLGADRSDRTSPASRRAPAVRLGQRRVRVRRSDFHALLERASRGSRRPVEGGEVPLPQVPDVAPGSADHRRPGTVRAPDRQRGAPHR